MTKRNIDVRFELGEFRPGAVHHENAPHEPLQVATPTTNRAYRFSFWMTFFCCLLALPLSILALWSSQQIVALWAWLNGPDVHNFLSWEYWLLGVEVRPSYLGQMISDSILSFFVDSICVTASLLFVFWVFIEARRKWSLSISLSSIVMVVCISFVLYGLTATVFNAYYSWRVYSLGLLGCNLLSSEFIKCNYVLLELPRISSSVANLIAAGLAGSIYSRRLDDTEKWVEDIGRKIDQRLNLYGAKR